MGTIFRRTERRPVPLSAERVTKNGRFAPVETDAAGTGFVAGENAVYAARWFAHDAARVYSMSEDSAGAGGQWALIDWVRRKHPAGVTSRNVQRSLSKYKSAAAAEGALDGLVRDGLGSWEERTPGSMGGAPTRVFVFTDATPANGGGIPH